MELDGDARMRFLKETRESLFHGGSKSYEGTVDTHTSCARGMCVLACRYVILASL
jgi:hypothetical protein